MPSQQGSSSSYHQEQFRQPSDEELFCALKDEDFYFPIESLTFGLEEDQQVSFIERPSIDKSQVWIDSQHGEMTLLVGEEKMKFGLHQRTPLTDEEMRAFIREQACPLEGYKFEANSFPTKELVFELLRKSSSRVMRMKREY